jgi:hypothetical protein
MWVRHYYSGPRVNINILSTTALCYMIEPSPSHPRDRIAQLTNQFSSTPQQPNKMALFAQRVKPRIILGLMTFGPDVRRSLIPHSPHQFTYSPLTNDSFHSPLPAHA